MSLPDLFREIWLVDFEFHAPPGERPQPVCLAAREFRSGRQIRLWQDELRARQEPPYPVGTDSLFVAYYASAELGCHLALAWPMPQRILDLYAEFRRNTTGLAVPHGNGLLAALAWHGLDAMAAVEKDSMRQLVLRGSPWTADERRAILDYCAEDVDALARLLPAMWDSIDLPRALLRGRYMPAVARMEHNGVPIDTAWLRLLLEGWDGVRSRLIGAVDADYGVFDGNTFKTDRWESYLAKKNIPWPRLDSGALALDDDTFRDMARAHPAEVGPMRELRVTLGQLKLNDLAVGGDGRNRTLLSPFASKTSRNQPSTSRFIFGPSCWLRSLIKPGPGRGLFYADWSGQEYGIAAALSGDAVMMRDYTSGDPYLAFGRRIGYVPPGATKKTHGLQREALKVACGLGAMYGSGPDTLAITLGVPRWQAKEWLRQHRDIYRTYWKWSESVLNTAMLTGRVQTVFGWTLRAGPDCSPRSFTNFPMQANGAEMMRLACCLATERGHMIDFPVHDALLGEAAVEGLEAAVAGVRAAMAEASRVVLDGFELRTDVKTVMYPDRYADPRGTRMWQLVTGLLSESDGRVMATVDGGRLSAVDPPIGSRGRA
jgi:hypothetical protein